jgi:hypothetical protein
LGPQDYLPSNPKRLGPVIPRRWDRSGWNRDASPAAADYTNTPAASDACAPCLVRPHIRTGWLYLTGLSIPTKTIATPTSLKPIFTSVASANHGNYTVDLTSRGGQTIGVKFLIHQNGLAGLTGMFVDDVQLTLSCGPSLLRRAIPSLWPRLRP